MIKIPSKGKVVLVIGNPELCEPCRKAEEFIEMHEDKLDLIDVLYLKMDSMEFSKENPGIRLGGIPKVLFIKDGTVVINSTGFSVDRFIKLLETAFPVE